MQYILIHDCIHTIGVETGGAGGARAPPNILPSRLY